MNRLNVWLLASLLTLSTMAVPAAAESLSDAQEQQLNELESLLRENPEVIDSLVTSVRRYLDEQQQTGATLENQREWLTDHAHPALGNLQGERLVVVFNDYNCPFCKRLEPELQKAMKDFKDLKVINIFLPLRQRSVEGLETNSAMYAMQVWQDAPKRFPEVHQRLMDKSGMHNAASLKQIAKATGTETELEQSAGQERNVQEAYEVFSSLGLRGTPSLIIGDEVLPGYVPYERLKPLLNDAR